MQSCHILDRPIGPGHPVYLIAELSGNHNQSLDKAMALVEAAHEAGADAVKVQTYTAETMTIDCAAPPFVIDPDSPWGGRTFFDLYQEAYTPWEWQPRLQERARELGMHFFSTPFDATAVDFLEELRVPVYKIASFELTDLPLLRKVAATGKPVIMSTGMATLAEIDESVRTLRAGGCRDLMLLKCCSAYPADPALMNLRTIPHLAQAFEIVPGLSDHTMDVAVPVAAVTLGACVVEKHLTLDRADKGPDSAFSLEPAEFAAMVRAVRTASQALGRVSYDLSEGEQLNRGYRRSLFVVEDMAAGERFTPENVRSIRPGDGLPPRCYDLVMERRASRALARGTPLGWELLQ